MKKVLVLGGSGYIGTRLGPYLKALGHDVASVDIGWTGIQDPKTVVKDYRNLSADVIREADAIILLAGHSSVKMCEGPIASAWNNNVSNFVDLVGKMRRDQQLIYASSGSVYGNGYNDIFQPINNYDITKYVLDLEAQKFISDGYKIVGLRFGTVNGYSDNLRAELMINAMVYKARNEGVISINNKYIKRPLLALSDLCGAMEAIIEQPIPRTGIYDLCSFTDRVIDIAMEVCHATKADLQETPDRQGVYDFDMKNDRFGREFDFQFKATRQSIIEEVISGLNYSANPEAIIGDRNKYKEYL
jgi:nucleoside-diphosphate-sugar epimerase